MNAQELREMTDEELAVTLEELRQESFNLRFQVATRQLENTARMRDVRRDIARVMTVMRERELQREGE